MSTILSVLAALALLSLIVTVHEFGHYLAGRKLGFTILEFAIGMGPMLLKKEKDGIQYSLRALPIGGMCRFYGEDAEVKDDRCFNSKAWWKRLIVVFSGPFMNFVFAIVISIVTLACYGDYMPSVFEVSADSPAYVSGMQTGDVITAVDGKRVAYYDDAVTKILAADNGDTDVTVARGKESVSLHMEDIYDATEGRNLIGVIIEPVRVRFSFLDCIGRSFGYAWTIVKETFSFFGNLFRGQVQSTDVAGPVGIISYISQAVRTSMETVLRFAMMISLSVGIMNILPLPALDGGRMAFMLLEGVRGKPIPPEKEGMVHFVGIILLFGLIIFLTYNDVSNLIRR